MVRTARGLEDAVWQSIALRPMHCNRQTVCTPLHMACGRDEYNWGVGGLARTPLGHKKGHNI